LKAAKGREINKVLKKAHSKVGKFVKKETSGTAASSPGARGPSGSNRAAAKLAASFKSSPVVGGARIVSNLPYAFGAEFGANRFRQFPSWVGKGSPGRVGWAAVIDNEKEIGELYLDSLMDAFKKAYPNG
jgi:hypothetical protein